MKPQLAPGQNFAEFLEGAEAAGQGDETVGQLGHARLAGVHRIDDFDPRQCPVIDGAAGHFLAHQGFGNDADDRAAGGQTGIGHGAHQADIAGAVDQFDATRGQQLAELFGFGAVDRVVAGVGATEDADSFHVFLRMPRFPAIFRFAAGGRRQKMPRRR